MASFVLHATIRTAARWWAGHDGRPLVGWA
jgi:hypothetical protein